MLCEKEIWEEVKPVLSSALEKEIFTPTRESVFEVRRVDWENFNLYRYRRNLLVIGYLGGKGDVSRLIEQLLTDQARRAVRAGDAHLFSKEDAWADGQLLLVVAASEGSSLSSVLESEKNGIYKFFDEGGTKRIGETIYGQGYQEDTAERLQKRYGWSIHLPWGYKTAEEDSEGNFVSFIRHYPDRLIFIYWDQRKSSRINSPLCFSTRNYLGDKYFEGDTIDQDRTETEWLDFQTWRALRVKGIWRNDDKVMGGPFQTYCFYDERQERFYLVDGHVFAPGRRKLPWLKELDLICQTFRTH